MNLHKRRILFTKSNERFFKALNINLQEILINAKLTSHPNIICYLHFDLLKCCGYCSDWRLILITLCCRDQSRQLLQDQPLS